MAISMSLNSAAGCELRLIPFALDRLQSCSLFFCFYRVKKSLRRPKIFNLQQGFGMVKYCKIEHNITFNLLDGKDVMPWKQ